MEKTTHRRFFRDRLKEDRRSAAFRKAYDSYDAPVRIAVQIAKLRESLGMTQAGLARKVGTRQQVISRLEKGEEWNPTLGTLERIAHAFGKRLELAFR